MNNTFVICGFPGVGKSSIVNNKNLSSDLDCKELKISDSDSSDYSWIMKNGKKIRNPDFPNNYIEHIKCLISQEYDFVFTSTHKEVLNALQKNNINFLVIYPDRKLKDAYTKRYINRGSPDSFVDLLSNQWDNFIDDIEERNCHKLKLTDKNQNVLTFMQDFFNDTRYYSCSSNYHLGCLKLWDLVN